MRSERESERGGRIAEKIDDGKGWQESWARDERDENLPGAKQRRNSEGGGGGGGWFVLYLTGARMRERRFRGGSRRGKGRANEEGDERGGGERRGCTGVLGGWVLVRFSRGKRRRGVRAASGWWCIIDPSVCGLGKKRSLRLGPRKRGSDTFLGCGGEKEIPRRSLRQILEMRSPLTRHAASLTNPQEESRDPSAMR